MTDRTDLGASIPEMSASSARPDHQERMAEFEGWEIFTPDPSTRTLKGLSDRAPQASPDRSVEPYPMGTVLPMARTKSVVHQIEPATWFATLCRSNLSSNPSFVVVYNHRPSVGNGGSRAPAPRSSNSVQEHMPGL